MSQPSAGNGERVEGPTHNEPEITWVGLQHLMHGYCGRAAAAEEPVTESRLKARPVAIVRTKPRQGRVVRIGPPTMAGDNAVAAAA